MAVGWYIFFGILLFFAFLLSLKANIKLAFKDELVLSVRVLCFTFRIVPGKEKKPIDYKKYSYKKHQKRLRKNYAAYLAAQQKKAAKAEAKRKKKEMEAAKTPEQKKAEKKAKKEQPKRSILDWLNLATSTLGVLFKKFFKHLHIQVARLKIRVATGDAASTAVLYGAVIQSVAYMMEILNRITHVDGLKKAEIEVVPDYLAEKTTMDMCFVFSLRVWHVFAILFSTLGRFLKKFFETNPKAKERQNSERPMPPKRRRKRKKAAAKASSSPRKPVLCTENDSHPGIAATELNGKL